MEPESHPEEDPFAEYLSQEVPSAPQHEGEAGVEALLRLVAESSQRQEQLLGKVCSLLVSLDEKMGRMAAAQERMQDSLLRAPDPGLSAAAPKAPLSNAQRGALVAPPGKPYAGAPAAGPSPEEQRLAQERLLADQKRIEEENRRRAEELARQRAEEERRRREDEERRRQEEERRREEERRAKEELGKKTDGLLSGLLSQSGGGGLFGDDEPKRASKGGLFDD
ncbi:unnamed protein product [Durusdinium trenchii]|uniref:Reticulocyte-binding protein 2 homolog a n=2 Tax=Durusdinium trenchii TaxID=1381693 RepID=A0ABP0LUG5_9DINO